MARRLLSSLLVCVLVFSCHSIRTSESEVNQVAALACVVTGPAAALCAIIATAGEILVKVTVGGLIIGAVTMSIQGGAATITHTDGSIYNVTVSPQPVPAPHPTSPPAPRTTPVPAPWTTTWISGATQSDVFRCKPKEPGACHCEYINGAGNYPEHQWQAAQAWACEINSFITRVLSPVSTQRLHCSCR